jgi:hypothetical protein
MGKNVSKSSLSRANQDRDYRIFEEYAYFLVREAQLKRKTAIFKLEGNVYAFDSTTIDLCLAVFQWAKLLFFLVMRKFFCLVLFFGTRIAQKMTP